MFECPRNGTLGARWLSALASMCQEGLLRQVHYIGVEFAGTRVQGFPPTQRATLKLTIIRLKGSIWVFRLQIPNEADIPKTQKEQRRISVVL